MRKETVVGLIIVFALFVIAFGKVQAEEKKYDEGLQEQAEIYEESLKELLEDSEVEILMLESKIRNMELEYKELESRNKELELEVYSNFIRRYLH